jgi:hypothetical protein
MSVYIFGRLLLIGVDYCYRTLQYNITPREVLHLVFMISEELEPAGPGQGNGSVRHRPGDESGAGQEMNQLAGQEMDQEAGQGDGSDTGQETTQGLARRWISQDARTQDRQQTIIWIS